MMNSFNRAMLIALLLLTTAGCAREGKWRYTTLLIEDAGVGRNGWVLECIKNGNPLSDEEGEDLVRECANRGKELHPRTALPAVIYMRGSYEEMSPSIPCTEIGVSHPAYSICARLDPIFTGENQ